VSILVLTTVRYDVTSRTSFGSGTRPRLVVAARGLVFPSDRAGTCCSACKGLRAGSAIGYPRLDQQALADSDVSIWPAAGRQRFRGRRPETRQHYATLPPASTNRALLSESSPGRVPGRWTFGAAFATRSCSPHNNRCSRHHPQPCSAWPCSHRLPALVSGPAPSVELSPRPPACGGVLGCVGGVPAPPPPRPNAPPKPTK